MVSDVTPKDRLHRSIARLVQRHKLSFMWHHHVTINIGLFVHSGYKLHFLDCNGSHSEISVGAISVSWGHLNTCVLTVWGTAGSRQYSFSVSKTDTRWALHHQAAFPKHRPYLTPVVHLCTLSGLLEYPVDQSAYWTPSNLVFTQRVLVTITCDSLL
jgi:hypothetical protein